MFDYLGVLISVILGMALTHVLKGFNRLIQTRQTAKPYWVHLVWSFNMLIYVLGIWWGMFWWKHLEVWTIEIFFFLAGYSIVLYLLAGILYPVEAADDIDYEKYFFANRHWFFGIQTLAFLMDIPETVLKGSSHLRDVPHNYVAFLVAILSINAIGLMTDNRRIHGLLCIGWLVSTLAYLTLTAMDRIATTGT
jgi:hypothetical protein